MKKIDFEKQKIPFTQVANGVLYDKKLSLGAKTIYAFMYSKPDGWNFSAYRIGQEVGASKTTILKHLNELKESGYLLSQKLSNGRMLYKVVFPPIEPESKILSLGDEPESKKATVQKSHGAESSPISNKEIKVIKNNTSNKDIAETSSAGEISLLIEEFSKINPACKRMYGNTTQRGACSDLIESYGFDRTRKIVAEVLPKTNKMTAQYFPNIGTPLQLFQKWQKLEDAIFAYRAKRQIKNNNVFW